MTKDIFIFYLTLIFFPFQEKPAKERLMLSVIIKTKNQRKKHTMHDILKNAKQTWEVYLI
jgi:hypothetical protein